MDSVKNIASRLFQLSPIDTVDEVDEKFVRCYSMVTSLIGGISSEKEAHDALNATVSKSPQNHEDINVGLFIAVLIEPNNGPRYYRDLTYVSRDGLGLVINFFTQIILEKYFKLQDACRNQLVWFLKELIRNSINNVDSVCFTILRQIAGGDLSQKNVWLAEAMLDVFIENKLWVEKFPVLIATIVYTYLRLIDDHSQQAYTALRQKEVEFCVSLLRDKFADCMMIGRDLVRLLQIVARIPEIEKLWRDIISNPTSLASTFTSVQQLLTMRTSRRFLQCRLTPDMEKKILFLTSQVKFGHHKRYQDWFQKQYLSTPESQSLRCDLIRFICGVIHPSNEVLCSEIIPRWAVIGWLLTTCTSNVAASVAKLSLFYDWFFFDPERDNIMNIEPAILVMHHSIRPHPAITATLLDFLCRIMPNFYVPLKVQVKLGIFTALRHILEKRVLPSLSPLFDNPKLDGELRVMIRESFSEFCQPSEGKLDEPIRDIDMTADSNHNSILHNDGEAHFSEEEEDMPLGVTVKHQPRETKFRPIKENSNKIDHNVVAELMEQLSNNLKQHVISLQNEKDGETRCETMEKLLEALLEEEFDQDITSSLGVCLAHIFSDDFNRKIFPTEIDDESIEDSIGTPLFVMFRTLCQMPEDDPSRQPLLNVLAVMSMHQARLGYLLLYFIKASKIEDNRMSSYKDYVNTQGSWAPVTRHSESKDLASCLLSDLKLCQEDDVRMFCYLVPDIYTQFPNVAIGNSELLNLVVSCIDPLQLQDLICLILQKNIVMFRKDSFLSVLNASLEWEAFEQICLWQLITAHNIPLDYILPILPKLEFHVHAEALTSILLLLKQEKPTPELLKHLMSRDAKSSDRFVVSVLNYWMQESEEKLAELIAMQLTKSNTSQKRKRQQANKSQGPSIEQTLSHLDQLRSSCKQNSFFSLDAVQSSILNIQSSCSDALKAKYSDLFALVEDMEEMKSTKSRAGGRGKNAVSKNQKSKPIPMDSDTETDSTEVNNTSSHFVRKWKRPGIRQEQRAKKSRDQPGQNYQNINYKEYCYNTQDEEAIKPKPRKKKRTAHMLGFDSD